MSPDLDQALCTRYPRIFANRQADPLTTCMTRGFECGDGWYALIDALCSALQHETDQCGAPQIVAQQVKEKFGTLRVYVERASEKQRELIKHAGTDSAAVCEISERSASGQPCVEDGWLHSVPLIAADGIAEQSNLNTRTMERHQ